MTCILCGPVYIKCKYCVTVYMSAQAAENVSQLNIGAKYCILTHALCDVCLVSLTCV